MINSSSEKMEKFKQLQRQLSDRWQNIDIFDHDDYDILVVPSFSIDTQLSAKISGFLHYEERLLFSLIRLRNPQTRLVYITSLPLDPIIVEYYLQLLPGIPFSHARERLLLISTYDASLRPLTEKILERPRLLEKIRKYLRRDRAYMVCFNSTYLEQELSLALGIPLLASSPDLSYWGTKSGSREIFTLCKIPHPDGSLKINNLDDLVVEIVELWERKPKLEKIVIKLNEGFSGEGNAILDLYPIRHFAPGKSKYSQRIIAVTEQLPFLRFQSMGETWLNFSQRLVEIGGIVEAFIEGEEKRSPSVQGYISPTGKVEIISTHDQILGGPDGQIYLGCSFPADVSYRLKLQELGKQIGQFLATKGAMERYAVDFIAVRNGEGNQEKWNLQAIEINLRKGGTTHPFMTLKLLTNGKYDLATGLFFTQDAQAKYYVASDNLQKLRYRGLLPTDLMDIIAKHRLHFDSSTQTGTVFHLMGALSEFGKLGLTSIGNSPDQALSIYQEVKEVLNFETEDIANNANLMLSSNLSVTWFDVE